MKNVRRIKKCKNVFFICGLLQFLFQFPCFLCLFPLFQYPLPCPFLCLSPLSHFCFLFSSSSYYFVFFSPIAFPFSSRLFSVSPLFLPSTIFSPSLHFSFPSQRYSVSIFIFYPFHATPTNDRGEEEAVAL